jgi:quercetin dioxygenase-like cupin family protein
MALPAMQRLVIGGLTGSTYTFADVGDELPLHDHDEATAHISIITRGRFTVSGPGWSKVKGPGPIDDFPPGHPHQFTALEAGSVVVNILRGKEVAAP